MDKAKLDKLFSERNRIILAGIYLALVAGAGVCWAYPAIKSAQAATAMSRIADLEFGLERYHAQFGCYPQGDGSGTRDLLKALSVNDAEGVPFINKLGPEFLRDGHFDNPVDRSKWIHYQCPGVHNPTKFDLWCEDNKGIPDGINNWSR